jgi:hypothetical protein
MSPRTPQISNLLVPSAASSRNLGEEQSGVRERSAAEREAEARGIGLQLEREGHALVQGLEALRFAFNGRSGAEMRTLKGRAQALAHVRDGLLQVLAAASSVPRLFRDGTAFVEYLRGVAAWSHATLEALWEHARSLGPTGQSSTGAPTDFAWRVELAKNLHFDELMDEVEAELAEAGAYDPAVDAVRAAMERLFYVARALEARL